MESFIDDMISENKFILYNPKAIFYTYGPPRQVWYKSPEPTNDERIKWAMNRMFGDGNIILMTDEEWRKTNGLPQDDN